MIDPRPLAIKYFQQGLYKEALPVLLDAAAKYPQDGYVQLCLGIIFASQKDLNAAEPYLRNAVRMRPQDAHACYNLACLLHQTSRHQEALALYDTAASLDPTLIAAKVAANNLRQSMGLSGGPAGHTIQQPPGSAPYPPHSQQPNPYAQQPNPYQTYPHLPGPDPYANYSRRRNSGRVFSWLGFTCLMLGCCTCTPFFSLAGIALSILGIARGDVGFGVSVLILCIMHRVLIAMLPNFVDQFPLEALPIQPNF